MLLKLDIEARGTLTVDEVLEANSRQLQQDAQELREEAESRNQLLARLQPRVERRAKRQQLEKCSTAWAHQYHGVTKGLLAENKGRKQEEQQGAEVEGKDTSFDATDDYEPDKQPTKLANRRKLKSLIQGSEEDKQQQMPQEQGNDVNLIDLGSDDKPTGDHEIAYGSLEELLNSGVLQDSVRELQQAKRQLQEEADKIEQHLDQLEKQFDQLGREYDRLQRRQQVETSCTAWTPEYTAVTDQPLREQHLERLRTDFERQQLEERCIAWIHRYNTATTERMLAKREERRKEVHHGTKVLLILLRCPATDTVS